MAELMYNVAAKKLKNTGFYAPAFIVFSLILIVGFAMLGEDYMTSVNGYESTPSKKHFWIVTWLVAALPQLIQMATIYIIIGFSYTNSGDNERDFYGYDVIYLAFIVWVIAFLLDGYWDYTYKILGYIDVGIPPSEYDLYFEQISIYWGALGESYIVYGLLSEVLTTVVGGLWVAMFQDGAFAITKDFLFDIGEMLGEAVGILKSWISAPLRGLFGGLKTKKQVTRKKTTQEAKSTNYRQGGRKQR